jgi:hypothetical protein
MLVYLKAPNFIFFLMNSLQACLFLRFIPGFGNIRARKLWEFSGSPESIFERSPEDFQTLEDTGTVHIQLIKGWKKYSDRVYKAEENLLKTTSKPCFWVIPPIPKHLLFVPMHPWFCFTRETSILVSVSSSASLVPDPAISMGKRFVVNWSLACGSLIRLSSRVLRGASISLPTIKPLNPI